MRRRESGSGAEHEGGAGREAVVEFTWGLLQQVTATAGTEAG
ncbi:hypothetical protein [Streptomyces sp. SID8014]|nr:hypothetical protein [Streptomyces sp. SID8014]